MIIRLNAARRRQLANRERGAATLESVGMYAVAALLAGAVMLAAIGASPVVGDRFRQALCMLTTMGQGPCESSQTSAADHRPTEPCVVTADGHTGAVEASAIVTLGGSEQFLVEKLSNGQSRVTRGTGGKVGVGVGVGANISATWNDKTVGGAAKADAGVSALFSGGEVYYADNKAEVDDIMSAHKESVLKDVTLSGLGPVRQIVDSAEDLMGVGYRLPPPDEVYIEGDVHLDAKAQVTALTANAQAGRGASALLGTRRGTDGTSTTYYKASLDGNISAGTWAGDEETGATIYSRAGLEGAAEGIIEVESDAKGNITAVRAKSVLSGKAEAAVEDNTVNDPPGVKNGYSERVVELPILSATDQATAQRFLNGVGMGPMGGFKDLPEGSQSYLPIPNPLDAVGATKAFAQAASQRGLVTKQSFDNDTGSYAVNFDAEEIAKLGGAVTVERVGLTSTGAQYWNGSEWAKWIGCGGK